MDGNFNFNTWWFFKLKVLILSTRVRYFIYHQIFKKIPVFNNFGKKWLQWFFIQSCKIKNISGASILGLSCDRRLWIHLNIVAKNCIFIVNSYFQELSLSYGKGLRFEKCTWNYLAIGTWTLSISIGLLNLAVTA